MVTNKFLAPTLEEYQALVQLKKYGVETLTVRFYGSGDEGSYDNIEFYPHPDNLDGLKKNIKVAEKYLYRNLDVRADFSFDNEGCQGDIQIDLSDNEFRMVFSTEVPVWTPDVYVEGEIAPETETERLVAEVCRE